MGYNGKKTTETIEREAFVWNCPECGEEIKSRFEMYADKPCADCTRKADAETFRLHTKHLIGARIIDVGGEYYSSFSSPKESIDCIIVSTKEGKQFVIAAGDSYNEGTPELAIDEVVHPSKVEQDDK